MNWGRVTIRTPLQIKLLNNSTCILIGLGLSILRLKVSAFGEH